MANKDDYNYTWTKGYMVHTHVNNEVKVGDDVIVDDRNGGSPQKVLSVTVMNNRSGRPYKVLLLQSLETKETKDTKEGA